MSDRVTVRAPAKINLHLGVGPCRADGFHGLATVYQAIGLYDDVTVTDSATWSVTVTPVGGIDCSGVPLDDANIAIRAGRLLARHHGIERAAAIDVHKGIPVAGGLAGGSADAAATMIALDRLWELETSDDDLLALAAQLGSDVPFALVGGTARGTGRGELVEPMLDTGEWWWAVCPSTDGLSTPTVYAELDRLRPDADEPRIPAALEQALAEGDVHALAAALANDLEAPAVSLRPDVGQAVQAGREHALAGMVSGSGPTTVFLCADREQAVEVLQALGRTEPHQLIVAPAPVAGAHVVRHA